LSCESFQNEIMPYLIVYSLNSTKNRHRLNTDENTGTCPLVVGPFEEEEEGTGVATDVIKVEGEDLATSGPLI